MAAMLQPGSKVHVCVTGAALAIALFVALRFAGEPPQSPTPLTIPADGPARAVMTRIPLEQAPPADTVPEARPPVETAPLAPPEPVAVELPEMPIAEPVPDEEPELAAVADDPVETIEPVPEIEPEIVQEIASEPEATQQPVNSAPESTPEPQNEASPNFADIRNAYLARFHRQIEAQKHYPPQARRLRRQGRVLLLIGLTAEGTLNRLEVAQSSGFLALDEAALSAVQAAAPFAPPPQPAFDAAPVFSLGLEFSLR